MGRNGLEGEESHTDRRTTVWRCLSNREGERGRERKMESGPPECPPHPVSPLFPFLFFGRGVTIQPEPVTKMSSVHSGEKKSVSQQQLDCFALTTLCVCVCVQGVGVQTTHYQKCLNYLDIFARSTYYIKGYNITYRFI